MASPVGAPVGIPVGGHVWSGPGLPVTLESAAISAAGMSGVEDADGLAPGIPPGKGSERSSCERRVEEMTCKAMIRVAGQPLKRA